MALYEVDHTSDVSFCTGAALCIETARAELELLYNTAPEAQSLAGRAQIYHGLWDLAHAWDAEGRRSSYAHACVGTDDVDDENPALPIVRHGMQLMPSHVSSTFDVRRDIACLVCGRSAASLAIRLRWPCVTICTLGAAVSITLVFVVHWANGGLGQFAVAYPWARWLEVWICVGWWLAVGVVLLWYASMQREIAWMALKQFSTLWVIALTGVLVAGMISLHEFGVHRSTWVQLPLYIGCALFFPLVAMADALPPKVRLPFLRFLGPFALGTTAILALVLRLPTAKGTPGELVWTVMGVNTVTNLQVITYAATVMMLLLAEGLLRAWVFPNQFAFVWTSLCITAGARTSDGSHAAIGLGPPLESVSIAGLRRMASPFLPYVSEDTSGRTVVPSPARAQLCASRLVARGS